MRRCWHWWRHSSFADQRSGFFVDVGAGLAQRNSNTWFLEHERGWSGLAVDAQATFAREWAQDRPASTFVTAFVSDRSGGTARLWLSAIDWSVASTQQMFTARFGPIAGYVDVPMLTLTDILARAQVTTIDLLSMDIELAEPQALAGFDLARFRPALVGIEAHHEVRQQILDYFAARQYRLIGRYLRIDVTNLWFMPGGFDVDEGRSQVSHRAPSS